MDELIVVPDSPSELVSASTDSTFFDERVIMVDDETSTDCPQSVETGTQTFLSLPSDGDIDIEGKSMSSFGDRDMTFNNELCFTESHDYIENVGHSINISPSRADTTSLSGDDSVVKKPVCSNRNCLSRMDKHLVSIGVNTAPKVTFEKETHTSLDCCQSGNNMTIYVGKMDKGTSTLNRVRIVRVRASGMGKKTKSVDKITMTSRVEQREVGVETDAQQVDGKITECISKLRSVSERLNSPSSPSTSPPSKESFVGGEQTDSVASPTCKGSELSRQTNVKNLLEKTNAILRRKDPSPTRKPQPITTLKPRKSPATITLLPSSGNNSVSEIPENDKNSVDIQSDSDYNSKSLPRGFTSERRSGTVKMGSQPLSPVRLPLNRYNSAPGRIATVPAQTLLLKSNCAAGKLSRSPSPRLSPNNIPISPKGNPPEVASNVSDQETASKSMDSKALSSHPAAIDSIVSKPQKRHPLPSITETRTPSSCSDNSTTSLHSSGSGASKHQSTESFIGKKSSPGANKRYLNGAQTASTGNMSSFSASKSGPKSPLVIPKRLANISIGAPSLPGNNASPNVKDAPKSPALRPKMSMSESMKSPSPKPSKKGTAKDQTSASPKPRSSGLSSNQPTALDPNRLSTQSSTGSAHSRSPSASNLLSVSMADSSSDTASISSRSSKEKIKSSPSKEKIKNSASMETIQSNTSNEMVDGTKPKKSGGIGFMQRFLSKKKKSSEGKKESVAVNTKLCPPTAEAVAALSTLPPPVSAAPTESYAHVPLQHPPHHYIPQLEVKPQSPIHKPSSYVYVNQRLISIQQDNVEEKKASREGKAKSGSILVAHKQAMFANKGGRKDKEDIVKDIKKAEDSAKEDTSRAEEKTEQLKKEAKSKIKPEKGKMQGASGTGAEKDEQPASETAEKDVSKSKDVKTKAKKSEVKSASSWIRGKGEKGGKK